MTMYMINHYMHIGIQHSVVHVVWNEIDYEVREAKKIDENKNASWWFYTS